MSSRPEPAGLPPRGTDRETRRLEVQRVGFADPVAQGLNERVQAHYVEIYGGPDASPMHPEQFVEPDGAFLVGLLDGEPVATAAWRRLSVATKGAGDARGAGIDTHSGDVAELKRMYVVPEQQGRGLSLQMLDAVEADARAHGISRMVLETGHMQPVAIRLYRTHGYSDVDGSGWSTYACHAGAVHLGKALGSSGPTESAEPTRPAAPGEAATGTAE